MDLMHHETISAYNNRKSRHCRGELKNILRSGLIVACLG